MLVLSRLGCNDSETVLILLVDGCPHIDSGSTHQITELIWFYSGRRQLSFIDSTQFVGKPEGVSNAFFFTYFDYFFGVNTNLGVERHQMGLNPQPSTNRALVIEDDIVRALCQLHYSSSHC